MQNSLVHIGQQGRFSNLATVRARPAPASPLVLQAIAQSIAELSEKVDALAQRPYQPPARQVESREIQLRPVTNLLAPAEEQAEGEPRRQVKVHRSELLGFFD